MNGVLTTHARKRMQQRGIRSRDVFLLHAYADIDVQLPGGATSMCLSRGARMSMKMDGWSPEVVDRLSRLAAVEGGDDNRVITLVKIHGHRGKRHLRRN